MIRPMRPSLIVSLESLLVILRRQFTSLVPVAIGLFLTQAHDTGRRRSTFVSKNPTPGLLDKKAPITTAEN